jgi:hypothetical protein
MKDMGSEEFKAKLREGAQIAGASRILEIPGWILKHWKFSHPSWIEGIQPSNG